MTLKKFEEYLKEGIVKKQAPNTQRALSLLEESEQKKNFLQISLKNIPEDETNANLLLIIAMIS